MCGLNERTSDLCSLCPTEAIERDLRLPRLRSEIAGNRGWAGAEKLPVSAEQGSPLSGGVVGEWKAIWLRLHFPKGPSIRLLMSFPLGLHFDHRVTVTGSKETAHHMTAPVSHREGAGGLDCWQGSKSDRGTALCGCPSEVQRQPKETIILPTRRRGHLALTL